MNINDLPNCLRDRMLRRECAKTVAEADYRLSLNVTKTELMIIGSRQRLDAQCEETDVSIDEKTIKRVDHTKSLILTNDAQLPWSKHVDEICKKASSAIGALKRVPAFYSDGCCSSNL